MSRFNRKKHWEHIYHTKNIDEVSWYQLRPETSISFFEKYEIDKDANIIDIGGGDSLLVDHLLVLGYNNITVLDISKTSIERAKMRLGKKANLIKWIIKDIATFIPSEKYDVWHDRAAFHFLTNAKEIEWYRNIATKYIEKYGILILGAFSENGPKQCSGIEIHQYSKTTLSNQFKNQFKKLDCFTIDHLTPFDTIQNFVFCCFTKL